MSLDIGFGTYDGNFTHNVTPMWNEAGIYDALYNSHGKKVSEVLEALETGLIDMARRPSVYRKMDSPNGWGIYNHALPWLADLVEAARDNKDATICISK